MREFDFIHAAEDVASVLLAASELGLALRLDEPTSEPTPVILDSKSISEQTEGLFVGCLPDWVFGTARYQLIDSGHNQGKYFQMRKTNYVGLQLYFSGERRDDSIFRLGNGFVSRDIEWYSPEDHSVHPPPSEVRVIFDLIRKKIDTKKCISAGGRRYMILPKALEKLNCCTHRPPFDFMDDVPVRIVK
jgi:hypothetical protein